MGWDIELLLAEVRHLREALGVALHRVESAEREAQQQRERADTEKAQRDRFQQIVFDVADALDPSTLGRDLGEVARLLLRDLAQQRERADQLEAEALRYYHADGTFEVLASAAEVVERRKAAAEHILELEVASSSAEPALRAADKACGELAEDVARHCDHNGIDGSRWYRAVKGFRKMRAALAAQPAQEVPPLPVVRPNEWCPRCNSYHFAPKPEEGQR